MKHKSPRKKWEEGSGAEFAAALVSEQERLRLKLPELAAVLGVGPRTLGRWMAGGDHERLLAVTQEGALARLAKLRRMPRPS